MVLYLAPMHCFFLKLPEVKDKFVLFPISYGLLFLQDTIKDLQEVKKIDIQNCQSQFSL